MRFIRRNQGEWGVGDLNPFEFAILSQLPFLADPGSHEGARKRLFPSPLLKPGSEEDLEFVADWSEFVASDHAHRFDRALQLFRTDLATAVVTTSQRDDVEEEDGKEEVDVMMATRFEIVLPDDHAWPWYSALNQARLVLNEKFKLHAKAVDDTQEKAVEPEDSDQVLAVVEGRWRARLHCEFYGMIQEWIIERVLSDEIENEGGNHSWNQLDLDLDFDIGDEENGSSQG